LFVVITDKIRERLARVSINRRKFLGLAGLAGAAVLGGDAILIAPNRPRVVREEIILPRWPSRLEGFRIVLLSDFHYDPYFSVHPLEAAIPMVNELRPDLIALTGDFVTVPSFGDEKKGADMAEPCAELLRRMSAPLGLWAVLGNHDGFSDPGRVTSALQNASIQVLGNRSVVIERNGARFWLSGVKDVLAEKPNLDAALHDVSRDEPVVLLAHEPDYADHVARYPVDLQLSGHSHGGQVRLPFLSPLYLPDLAKKYYWGLYKIGPLTLYTNAGLGTIGFPARLNCPPEITLIELRRSDGR